MIRSIAGLIVSVTINSPFYEGSGRLVEVTPKRIPRPTMTITPTPIHVPGICIRYAPRAKPTIITMNPTMYIPKDISFPPRQLVQAQGHRVGPDRSYGARKWS